MATSLTPAPAAPALTPESTLDEILHALIIVGISAASIFVKNPNSRNQAGQIINLVNTTVLPLVDTLLLGQNPPAA